MQMTTVVVHNIDSDADIFEEEKVYLQMERDFSETFTLSSAITKTELKGNLLCIGYLTGKDFKEVYEEIEF